MRDAEGVARAIQQELMGHEHTSVAGGSGCYTCGVITGDFAGHEAEAIAALIRARDAEVAAKAWDEGYAVGEDNFIHSDYCGRSCQCQGLHGATNPYREGGRDA